ncbi:hypothetical protein G3435_17895 [Pseudomonas sp. MAFF212428]|uniref:A-factor biosynthesis hotdog domain-containing protein n=1 Tax=Pseudomonas brassicae TaxID=2708063 RepID=A0A6B3NTF5_9PSED|nr:AfsA-related hotdog domain-containing protein [Pseudomonas brassicae]NER61329.1 hypothetical protein [Pseudomonas brassicae]NER65023.1 hypothetical protein [Pseudomonas brassicae]
MDRQLPLTPHILHKSAADDVLLSGLMDILPAQLADATVTQMLAALDPAQCQLLHSLYRQEPVGVWILRSIPLFIEGDALAALSSFEMDLQGFYQPVAGGYQLTAQWLPRQVEAYLQRHLNTPLLDAHAVRQMADLLFEWPQWTVSSRTAYTVLNDTNNYFFYNKPHEHVPGLMLIEVARQAMYHYVYSHTGYRRGEVSISIEDLNVSFSSYTESTYAVEVVVEHTTSEKRRQPRSIDKTATFFQNGAVVATLRLRGNVMKMPLFKRMRTLSFPEHHWFSPSARVLPDVLLQTASGHSFVGQLMHLSLTGLRFRGSATGLAGDQAINQAAIHVQGIGFISFAIKGCQPGEAEDERIAHFDVLDKQTLVALKEVIKCHCFHAPEQTPVRRLDASNEALAPAFSRVEG